MTKQELVDFCQSELTRLDALSEKILRVSETTPGTAGDMELAATSAFFHYFYTRIEGIIREILVFDGISDPGESDPQHRILKTAGELGIIPPELFKPLSDLLAFRTAFVHGKTEGIGWQELSSLLSDLPSFRDNFRREVSEYLAVVGVD